MDCEYITYPISYAGTVYFYHKFIYMYRLGRNGQSMDILSMQRNRAQHMQVLSSLLSFYDKLPALPEGKRAYIERCIAQVVENQFQIYISMGFCKGIFSELRRWDQALKRNYPRIYAATRKKSIAASADRVSGSPVRSIRISAGKGLAQGNIAKRRKIRYNFVTIL